MIDDRDRVFLARALELGARGLRTVAPNPPVGCVIVRHDTTVAEGWHGRVGGPHAEAMALEVAQEGARDATVYLTLEPCAHHGRTPPCTDALIAAGVARVVVLSADPAPHASGAGPLRLVDAGIRVDLVDENDPLALAARRLAAGFRTTIVEGRPHVTYKAAQTLDGRTATRDGDSRWISGAASRAEVHEWRARSGAVLVGAGTARADDPLLTARDCDPPVERQPLRVVWDRGARVDPHGRLASSTEEGPVLVLCGPQADAAARAALEARGVETEAVAGLREGLEALVARDVQTVLCEGGARLAGALLGEGLVDRLIAVVAPRILGDPEAPGLLGRTGLPAATMAGAMSLASWSWSAIGDDLWIESWLRDPP